MKKAKVKKVKVKKESVERSKPKRTLLVTGVAGILKEWANEKPILFLGLVGSAAYFIGVWQGWWPNILMNIFN
jgi:hypothetical protein